MGACRPACVRSSAMNDTAKLLLALLVLSVLLVAELAWEIVQAMP